MNSCSHYVANSSQLDMPEGLVVEIADNETHAEEAGRTPRDRCKLPRSAAELLLPNNRRGAELLRSLDNNRR